MLQALSGAVVNETAIEHVFADVTGMAECFNPFNAGDGFDPLDHGAGGAPIPYGDAGIEIDRRRWGCLESQEMAARPRLLHDIRSARIAGALEQRRMARAQQHGEIKSPEEHHVGIEDAVAAFRKSIGRCDLEDAPEMRLAD